MTSGKAMIAVKLLMTAEQRARLRAASRRTGVPMAQLMRNGIEILVAKHSKRSTVKA